MEEQKIQSLHDTLAKLKKTAGLGIASHYNFGKVKTKQVNGQTVREDGLPNNPLYFPFVKEGTFDPKTAESFKFGDGRTIKRNFDDCDAKVDDSVRSRDKKSYKKKRMKEEAREVKKAKKKAMKLEAKKQTKLEAKRQAKLEEKRAQKKLLEKKRIDNYDSCGGYDTNDINNGSNKNIETVDGNNKVKKHKSKKDSRRKCKDNEKNKQDDHTTNTLSSVTASPSNSESTKKKCKQNESTITSASLLVPVSDDATAEGKDKIQSKKKSKKSKREKLTLE